LNSSSDDLYFGGRRGRRTFDDRRRRMKRRRRRNRNGRGRRGRDGILRRDGTALGFERSLSSVSALPADFGFRFGVIIQSRGRSIGRLVRRRWRLGRFRGRLDRQRRHDFGQRRFLFIIAEIGGFFRDRIFAGDIRRGHGGGGGFSRYGDDGLARNRTYIHFAVWRRGFFRRVG
jgi:hypothetical protein